MNAQQKLQYVARQMGLTDLPKMQASTRNIYDSLPSINAAGQQYNFFQNVGQRNWPLANISQNKFQPNEALLVESIALCLSGEALPLGIYDQPAVADLIIANQTVLKDIPLNALAQVQAGFKSELQNARFFLAPLVGIVIPPQLEFNVIVHVQNAIDPAQTPRLQLELYGTGVLTNLQTSL